MVQDTHSEHAPRLRGLILDMDGVLWRDKQVLIDLPHVFAEIQRKGFEFILATNNSTRSGAQIQHKLETLGVHVQKRHILNSSEVAGRYLQGRFPQGGKVFVIGEQGLIETLQAYGFEPGEDDVLAVVVGLDRGFTYQKLAAAARCIQEGALFLGTNADATLPVPDGCLPGAGAILQAVQVAAAQPAIVLGKPNLPFFSMALQALGVPAEETLVVGDRLETDIQGGKQAGCRTALVLSGVTSADMLAASPIQPDWVAQNLEALIDSLPEP